MGNIAIRNYAHEHELRKKRKKRLHADIDIDKVELFRELLENKNISFVNWLQQKIDEEIKGD
jgi:hypothetical protein